MTRGAVLALALLLAACATPSIPATPEFLADREGRISRALAKAGKGSDWAMERERMLEAVKTECGDDLPPIEDLEAKLQACKAARATGRTPGGLRVGDTQEYVRPQWGPPDDIDTMLHAGGESVWWRWCSGYRCYTHVHFDNGVVTSIHQ